MRRNGRVLLANACSLLEGDLLRSQSVEYMQPDEALGLRLLPVARRMFAQTFGHLYDEEPFQEFLDGAYSIGGSMHRDLSDPLIKWRIAMFGDEPIAYAKLTPLRAPAPVARPGSLELQQLYVTHEWHGTGVAQELMNWSIDTAREAGASELYLTVFDHNERAKCFYSRNGFREVGCCMFRMGNRIDDDRVWAREL
jgi:diamine N-acetyltransferase